MYQISWKLFVGHVSIDIQNDHVEFINRTYQTSLTIELRTENISFCCLPLNPTSQFKTKFYGSISLSQFCGWYQSSRREKGDPTWCIKLFSTRKIEDRLCSRFSLNELIAWLSVPNKTIIAPPPLISETLIPSFICYQTSNTTFKTSKPFKNNPLIHVRKSAWFQMKGKRDQTCILLLQKFPLFTHCQIVKQVSQAL